MPRQYTMRRRSESVAQTRDRVVEAAARLFSERGARATTMTEVARLADVSPATVTNHFATPDLLLEAVVDRLVADLRVPNEEIFNGTRSVAARIRALTAAMFAFFERTEPWFTLLGTELTEVAVLARAQAAFWQAIRALHAQALSGMDDPLLAKAAAGLIHPATLSALKAAGMTVGQATAVVAESLVH
ncbi:MAG TPA: TetR/AcrR family transcriptional regulator, partial [Candidatus Limnocylindrales bacterium]